MFNKTCGKGIYYKKDKWDKTNEVKFWLTIYSYFDVSMIMVIIINKNIILQYIYI